MFQPTFLPIGAFLAPFDFARVPKLSQMLFVLAKDDSSD